MRTEREFENSRPRSEILSERWFYLPTYLTVDTGEVTFFVLRLRIYRTPSGYLKGGWMKEVEVLAGESAIRATVDERRMTQAPSDEPSRGWIVEQLTEMKQEATSRV